MFYSSGKSSFYNMLPHYGYFSCVEYPRFRPKSHTQTRKDGVPHLGMMMELLDEHRAFKQSALASPFVSAFSGHNLLGCPAIAVIV